MSNTFVPKAYMKSSCPFCFKFLLFMTEAGLLNEIEVIRIDADNEAEVESYRALLSNATGQSPTFPTVEMVPGEFLSDSDDLIEVFATRHQINRETLPTFAYYMSGLFPAYIARFKELKALKAELDVLKG